MKQTLLIIASILHLTCFSQTYTSNCSPGGMENIYKSDAYRLAIARLHEINSSFKDSVEIPLIYQDTIAKALYSIRNMSQSPLKDTILNLFGFSDFSSFSPGFETSFEKDSSHVVLTGADNSRFSIKQFQVAVLNSASWANDWTNGNYNNTANPDVNDLMNRYGLTAHFVITVSNYKIYYVSTSKRLNTPGLVQKFSLIAGTQSANNYNYCCDGNSISAVYEADGIRLNYRNACGDCPSGCTRSKTWTFKVYTYSDCHVEYLGAVDLGSTFFSGEAFVCTRNTIVPVVFISITAYLKTNNPVIEWKVASQDNTEKYIVEKSSNGTLFREVATVNAKGNSIIALSYSWQDSPILLNDNYVYYRVRAVDYGGSGRYTPVVKIHLKEITDININPNPIENKMLRLQFKNINSSNYTITLFSKEGKKIFAKTQRIITSFVKLPSTILSGTYIIFIDTGKDQLKRTIVVL